MGVTVSASESDHEGERTMAEASAFPAVRTVVGRVMAVMVVTALCGVAAGCASGRAQTVEDRPTLVVPPVPPRSIEPPRPAEPPAIEPVPEIPPATTPPAKPKPPANRNTTEPKPVPQPTQEPIPDSGTGVTPNPPPVQPLRTPTTPSGPDATRQIREILQRAEAMLAKVDYQRLSEDRRANYNTAKNWMAQADEALKKEDLTLARSFAERAENIAKQLEPGR
jgi:outer membrane biosynthesis protein TonB